MPRVTATTPRKRTGRWGEEQDGAFQTAKRPSRSRSNSDAGLGELRDVRSSPAPSETPTPPAHLAQRTYGSQPEPGEARRPKRLLHMRRGTVARALSFLDADADAAFTEADAKAGAIVAPTDQDGGLWEALRGVEGLAPHLAGVRSIELTHLCVETGSFALAACPQQAFRTADRALLLGLRALQWEPKWAELERSRLAVASEPRRAARAGGPPAASQGTEKMPSDFFDGPEEEAGAGAARGDVDGGYGGRGGARGEERADEEAEGGGEFDPSVSSSWRGADPAAFFAMLPPDSADSLDGSSGPSASDGQPQPPPLPPAAAPVSPPPRLCAEPRTASRGEACAGGALARPTPVRASAALPTSQPPPPGAARPGAAPTRAPAAPSPTDAGVGIGGGAGALPRAEQLAAGLDGADSALANLFAMAAAADARLEREGEARRAASTRVERCADYSDERLRALSAAFCAEDERIGPFPPAGPIEGPFTVHLLLLRTASASASASGGRSDQRQPRAEHGPGAGQAAERDGVCEAIGYVLHSGASASADLLPEIHHVYVAQPHRRRGHAAHLLRWWIERYAQHSFTFAVNDPNAQMQRVLSKALVQRMRASSSRVAGCSSMHYYKADSRLLLRTA